MFNHIPKYTYVDLNKGQFPNENKYAVFQCIKNILENKATLADLHACVQQNGREALETTINIKNIKGPLLQTLLSIIPPFSRMLKGRDMTPLDYAFLSGNEPIFSLLLAEGAEAN